MELLEAIASRSARVCVLGLGHVGLPLANRVAECGYSVTGIDSDSQRVEQLSSDLSLPGQLTLSTNMAALAEADIILICVPTPLKNDLPDMSHVEMAAHTIASSLRANQLVILESTSYPGTTQELLRTILEESRLIAGRDFFLGFSPERIDPGNKHFTLANTPKVVGGVGEASTQVMIAFYGSIVNEVVPVSSPAVAEMAKLLENTYRHVNIALSNEMAILCNDLGLDVWEVIEAASTKPFGFQPFYPGPGWGGHCIPVDPAYLSWRVRELGQTARFVELASEFNQRMPSYVVERVAEALATQGKLIGNTTVVVLGVSYKAETEDCRHSPALEIISALVTLGTKVSFHDPHVRSIEVNDLELRCKDLTAELIGNADLVLLHTGHSVLDPVWIAAHAQLIFDTRNFFKGVEGNIIKL